MSQSDLQGSTLIPDHPDYQHCKHADRAFLGHVWVVGRCVYCWLRLPR